MSLNLDSREDVDVEYVPEDGKSFNGSADEDPNLLDVGQPMAVQQVAPKKSYTACTLRTADSLYGNPRLYVPLGRPKRRRPNVGSMRTESEEMDEMASGSAREAADDEGPPTLSDPDGVSAVPTMKSMFRVYRDAYVGKADSYFQKETSLEDPSSRRRGMTDRRAFQEDTADDIEEQLIEEVIDDTIPAEDFVHADEEMMQPVVYKQEEEAIIARQQMEEEEEERMRQEEAEVEAVYYKISAEGEPEQFRKQQRLMHEEWPLYWDRPIDFDEACQILTGVRPVPPEKLCHGAPQYFKEPGTFVIDLTSYGNRHDIHHDGLGMWGKSSGRTRFFAIDHDNKRIRADDGRNSLLPGYSPDIKVMLRKYEHPSTMAINGGANKYVKKIVTAVSPHDQQGFVNLAVVIYEWIGIPFDFEINEDDRDSRRSNRRTPGMQPPSNARSWEMASFQPGGIDLPPTVNAYYAECPIYQCGAISFAEAASIVLGELPVDHRRTCDRVPQGYREAGTFVVDTRSFVTDAELRRDDNGTWGKPAGNSRYYKLHESRNECERVDKNGKLPMPEAYNIQVLCKRYEHPATQHRFVRKIYTGRVPDRRGYHSSCTLAVITYYWKGDPVPFSVGPQRKVRIRNSSSLEMHKHTGYFDMMDVEEEVYPDMMPSGSAHHVDAAAPIGHDDHLFVAPQQQTMPPSKRRKPTIPIAEDHGDDMGPGSSRQHAPDGTANFDAIRSMIYRRELENQRRFGSLLDRAERFLEHLERMGDGMPEQSWRGIAGMAMAELVEVGRRGGAMEGEDGHAAMHELFDLQEEVVVESTAGYVEGEDIEYAEMVEEVFLFLSTVTCRERPWRELDPRVRRSHLAELASEDAILNEERFPEISPILRRMTALAEEGEKQRRNRTKASLNATHPLPSSSTATSSAPLRRHRSLNERRNGGSTSRRDGVTDRSVTFHDRKGEPERPLSPMYCFVSELNFTKIINQLINNPAARKSALLIQALRQQITIASSKDYANRTIEIFAEKDVLSLKHRKHSAVATILMGTENGYEVKEQLCRFLNALASFACGRTYLLAIGGGKELFAQLLASLRSRRIYGPAMEHAAAAIQKLSIRSSVCRDLLALGYFDWLLPVIEGGRLSSYGAEYCTALMLNLLLNTNSPALIARHVDQMLAAFCSLLKMKNPGLCPLVNGALYAAFSFGRIRARARETKFESQLVSKLERADCALDHLHIPFLLKQMRGEAEMVRVPPPTGEDHEDTAGDSCEGDIDASDQLRPVGAELAGARLLLAKVLSESASTPSILDTTTKEEVEEESKAPPGTVPRSRARRSRAATKKHSVRPLSRSEPRRLTSAASMATFTVESEVRRPLTQPLALSQLAIALKTASEKERFKESKENLREEGGGGGGHGKQGEVKTARAPLRRGASKTESKAPPPSDLPFPTKEETRTVARTARDPSPTKTRALTKNNSLVNNSRSALDLKECVPKEKEATAKSDSEMGTPPDASTPVGMESGGGGGKGGGKAKRRPPLRVVTKEPENDKSPSFSPPLAVAAFEVLPEYAAPVTGNVPNRIPDDANSHDYISVFGSRPKVPRTPDREKKPTSVLLY